MKKVIAGLAAASVAGVAVPGMDSAHAQVSNEALKEINGQTQTQTTVTETKTVETTSELKYTVTADVLNVRSGAGTGHNVISKVKSGPSATSSWTRKWLVQSKRKWSNRLCKW